MAKRDKMKKLLQKSPSVWPAYKRLRNQCTYSIKAIQDYHHGLVEETRNDPKKM